MLSNDGRGICPTKTDTGPFRKNDTQTDVDKQSGKQTD